MILLNLPNVKNTMNSLLTSDSFDSFVVHEINITNDINLSIQGHMGEYATIRPIVLEAVKKRDTPSSMRFILSLSPANIGKTVSSIDTATDPSLISGMFINIVYSNGSLNLTTGISYTTFMKDVALEKEWDRLVPIFLSKHNIEFNEG
ncbi:MAG: hypothetical protein IJM91_00270 [Lachnospiraceae bacterium]|nr:hypothetical protein [Lachnospiraceae bacterium]